MALEQIVTRLDRSVGRLAGARAQLLLPHATTEDGRWELLPAQGLGYRKPDGGWQNGPWTGGFVAGQLWLAARFADDEKLADEARSVTELLRPRTADPTTHDLGFLFWPS